jgi:NAD(P)-dependent dehydrogenase (short-subunit alcohol dehydrogenase family)
MQNGKVALVTGANRGLGLETAKQLGEKGVTVILAARQLKAAEEAAASLTAKGFTAFGVQLDVTNATDRKAVVSYISDKFGKLDILINNAGVGPKDDDLYVNKAVETSLDEFKYVFDTNVFSLVALTNDLLPLLKKSDAGRIVNLSSILGSLTVHSLPESPLTSFKRLSYNASKTALNMFTVHLAVELAGTKIKVNSAHPGWVQTELGGDQAQMQIPEGAKTSVDLALIDADGPTGKFIHLGEELPW